MNSSNISVFPLCWPEGCRRTPSYQRSQGKFGSKDRSKEYARIKDITVKDALDRVLEELGRLGIREMTFSSPPTCARAWMAIRAAINPNPLDPGVAVYWETKTGERRCMAIDRYSRVAQNLAAVAATLEAMRAIDRHGGAEILDRAFTGLVALPAPEQWWQVLGFESSRVSVEQIGAPYRELAKRYHPDREGGSHEAMARINSARMRGEGSEGEQSKIRRIAVKIIYNFNLDASII